MIIQTQLDCADGGTEVTVKQIPLYEQIYEEIRAKIEERGYQVGDRLPSEKELSEQYHVSRITSKKAVELLAEEGLVTRIPGKGTFVIEHQETPKALEVPAGSIAEKKPLSDHTPVIGVVLDGFGADFGCQMLGSIEMECRNQGFGMMLICSYGRKDGETAGIERLRELGVSGIIIMCVHDENYSESILKMAVQHFPVVTIDRRLKGVPISFVGTDNEAASRELARYLLDRGYRKTCFVKPHAAETSTLQERIRGFKKAYNEYGLFADESLWITDIRATLPAYYQYRGEQQLAEDEEKIIEFIQKHPEIDSYFAVEYSLARIVYTCLRKLGLQEKCPVVCFDGSDNIVQESMFTHVKQDEKEIGSLSVRILADEIRGDDEVKTVLVPYHIREMTKTAMD